MKKLSRNMKIYIAFILLIGLLSTGNYMYAYQIDIKQINNFMTVGYNEISIVENFEKPKEITPGTSFKKEVTVKNTGSIPCYVRVFSEVSDSEVKKYLNITFNTEYWTYKQEDGYYYYKYILSAGETTVPLFDTVYVSSEADISKMKDFDIIVYSESVQSYGYADYREAFASLMETGG